MGKDSKSDRDRKRSRSRDRDRDRKRSRSRSPRRDRKRSRSRDRDRKDRKRSRSPRRRSRSRERKHGRKHKEEHKERKPERDIEVDRQKDADKDAVDEENKKKLAKEAENKELERIMEERRKKVEEWRERQKKLKMQTATVEAAPEEVVKQEEESSGKKWSLEDEDDDDEDMMMDAVPEVKEEEEVKNENGSAKTNGDSKMEVDDEVDPLDAFMTSVAKDIQKKRGVNAAGTARIVTINTAPTEEKNKGEILENEGRAEVVVDDFDLETAAQSLCHKARLLTAADHTKIYYRPFRKNFYLETSEVSKMKKAELKALRKELDNIEIKGKDCPKPIKTWAQCGVGLKVLDTLKRMGYTKPTPIQAQAIPAVMSGRDVIGIAKTGSGKTLAFLLPMFRHIMDQDELEEMDGPIALIMAPTRELCMQTWKEANKFAKVLNLRVVCAYGGVGISEQIADLKRGAEIIVCTPGRMIDLLVSNGGRVTNLRRVTYLVLDEADRMFDMGFEPQVMKIVDNIRPDRQTVLFSATFPRQMEALARKVLENPIEILVGGRSVVCSDITQNVVICEEHQKGLKLLELLGRFYELGSAIVFVDKQEKADEVCGSLINSGYAACSLHGGIDQSDRDSNIVDFKSGQYKVLVATSVAARGLDVKNLLLVVNYDCPNHYEDYVHRVGRTGRAGNKGYAYTFILPEHQERMAGEICRAFETAGTPAPPELKAMFEKFKSEMAAQGKEVHLGGKGFAGSGYKYDDEEAEADSSKKMMTRLLTNIEHGQADDDELEEQLMNMVKTTRRVVAGTQPKREKITEKVADKISEAKARAEALSVLKKAPTTVEKDVMTRAAESVMKGSAIAPIEMTPEMRAHQLANKLNEKLNYAGGEAPKLNMGDDWEYFEEEMDINDFPQQVRYKICSRESVGHIAEYADVGLSVRGTHYPNGREPKSGDRRLHLLIEARSEINLRRAKEEIVRIMKDSLRQLSQGPRGGMQARYRLC